MGELYFLIQVGDITVAKHVTLDYACIFLKAIVREFNDPTLKISIIQEPSCEVCEDKEPNVPDIPF